MSATQYSGYLRCFRLGLLLLLQLEGLLSSRNLFNKSVQLALVVVPLEVGFGEFQRGDRLLANEVRHLSEGSIAAGPSLGAEEGDLIEFGLVIGNVGSHWRREAPRPNWRSENDQIVLRGVFHGRLDAALAFEHCVTTGGQIPKSPFTALFIDYPLDICANALCNKLRNFLRVAGMGIITNQFLGHCDLS